MARPRKRGKLYYSNIMIDGVRLRECLHTDCWQQALENQKTLVDKVRKGEIANTSCAKPEWLKYRLAEALDVLYAESVQAGKTEGGLRIMRERAKPLKRLLGDKLVRKITSDDLAQYRAVRHKEGVCDRTIGMDLEVLRSVLQKAKRWQRIRESVKIAKSQSKIGRALTVEQKARLFRVAQSKPRWYRALYAGVIAVNTTARKCEVLNARFEDVDLFAATWRISKSKTKAGHRDIPLNPESRAAFARMYAYAEALLGKNNVKPQHFVFCACENNNFDYDQPQKSVRSAWRSLTEKAGLKGLRLHDLRHTAITDLAEANTPESVMEAMAGHLSRAMREHYTHIRTGAKEKAVAALGGTGILDIGEPIVPIQQ